MSIGQTPPQEPEKHVFDYLKMYLDHAKTKGFARNVDLQMWLIQVRHQILKIYGAKAAQATLFPAPGLSSLPPEKMPELTKLYVGRLQALVKGLENPQPGGGNGARVFFGHGRSSDWRELKDYVHDRLHLAVDEFNMESVAGLSTFERLDDMLGGAVFAFLVMTAEDEHGDGKLHARENVVHELGLFQGHLGRMRAIIVKEDGCAEFSNIIGLSQIRFPKGTVRAAFDDVRHVLEREGIIPALGRR
jgi:hypothetical protein